MAGTIEIRISKDGSLRVTTKGIKGKACLKETEWLEKALAVKESGKTGDFYLPDEEAKVARRH